MATKEELALGAKLLRQARLALKRGKAWIRGTEAKDAMGRSCFPKNPNAVGFCAVGSINSVGGPYVTKSVAFDELAKLVQKRSSCHSIVGFNDNQTKPGPVLKLFRDAERNLARQAGIGK